MNLTFTTRISLFQVAQAVLLILFTSSQLRSAEPDAIAPFVVRAGNVGEGEVRIVFSEPMAANTANISSNYSISGGAKVLGSLLSESGTNLVLSVSPLTPGETYTVTASGLSDLAEPPNPLGSGGRIVFTAMEFFPQGIGIEDGSIRRLAADSFDLTGGGTDIGGTGDRFQFAWISRAGNFDIQVRVASVTVSSPYVHAGLMARSTDGSNSPFAAVFASSSQLGCFFESRATAGTASAQQSLAGGFPVNYPFTHLRLRRAGNAFTGYGSLDGETWIQLGTATVTLPATVQVGLAVCGQSLNETATAAFRDYGPTRSTQVGTYKPDREPVGPSSRRTGIIFSEILYAPRPSPGSTNSLEFIELQNTGPVFEDLSGWRLSGGVDYRFPAGTRIPAGGFLVVAADPGALGKSSGRSGFLGPYQGALNNAGDTLRLRDPEDAIRLEMSYSPTAPWPVAANGTGHSLVLLRASFGENDARAWGISDRIGGSPGEMDSIRPNPQRGVVINEFLAHTDEPQLDYIELHNRGNSAVDLSGCTLTDDLSTNRFVIPPGTSIPARRFLVFDQLKLGFRLDATGETIYLVAADGTRILDAVRFEGQENGVASGRFPDGASTIRRLASITPGAANSGWRQENVVLTEIMYHPISGESADEYLEFYNRGTTEIDLGGWRVSGGVNYQLPAGTRLGAGRYLVIARDVARLRSRHSHLNTGNSMGNYSGTLSDSSDRVALARPISIVSTNSIGSLVTNVTYAILGETTYVGGGRWGNYSDGGGSSLELIDVDSDPQQAANWADSDETQKSKWHTVEFTGLLDLGQTAHQPNRFRISMLGAGECLLDDVEIFKVGSTNLILNNGFENGQAGWTFSGNHSTSFIQSTGAFAGNNCLHVVGQGDGDTGINAIRVNITSGATGIAPNNTATIRARARWIAGWPEVLLRTKGNWIELPARLTVPENLGSPGLVNSRAVPNAGPAIYDVSHSPLLPRANQPVVVTCRISDPDGFGALRLRYRVDPGTAYAEVPMRDDGILGDELAGDGIYSATMPGRGGGTVVGFVINATDADPSNSQTSVFPRPGSILPVALPASECLVRWDDPIPFGTFGHYHIWNTQQTQSRRQNALDNTFRDCTLVYGNFRVIYNAGFRDKGSPFHGGGGDYAVTVPKDEILLGATDRVFGSTGNGGSEDTGVRGRISAWLGSKLGIPYLHAHFVRVYRNGSQHQNISEDLEQPNHSYAENQFPGLGGEGDLHKIAIWFEFQDNNSAFDSVGATLERFNSGGALKLARYRWNWQRRPKDGTANNLTNVFELVAAANNTTDYANRLLQLADMEEWMRVFAFHRIIGNWDSYNFNVGQNMYAYKVTGDRWRLIPWDIDFVLGLGGGPTEPLGGGNFGGGSQDPIGGRMFNDFTFRRALWRAYIDAANGPLLPENYSPQIAARRNALLQNGVTGLASTNAIYTYINARRNYILSQLRSNDTNQIVLTGNGSTGSTTTATPTITLTGLAPFTAATLEVNGIPYPVTWTSQRNFSLTVPLTQRTNRLEISGADRLGVPLTNAPAVVTVIYTGTPEQPAGQVVINEIHYNPLVPGSSFIELYNNSSTTPFDLSNHRLDGAGYTFPEGAIIPRNGYLLLAADRRGFATAFGNTIPVYDVFPGSLDNGGELLRLVRPGPSGPNSVISDVRYDDQPPWPRSADGLGSSLQLIDPALGTHRVGNWAAASTNASVKATPGRVNDLRQGLPAFPSVWLNELLPSNSAGPIDNAGEREPYLELYNSGNDSIDLTGLFLTDNPTNLTRWPFPTGTRIAGRSFLTVWLDAQPEQATASALHAGFRPDSTSGFIGLVRIQGVENAPAVIDYLEYRELPAGRSIGSFPDGEPRDRRSFTQITPGASNDPSFPAVKISINEFLAGNTSSIVDPADGSHDDWIELHNAGGIAVDLTSYRLTDVATNSSRFVIPPGYVIPPGGYLLVWADAETKQNGPGNADLHTNFKLASESGYIGLFAPDGQRVDEINYSTQIEDVSSGRYPDGTPGPIVSFEVATPRTANFLSGGNRPPSLGAVAPMTVVEQTPLNFTAQASDGDAGQHLFFSLGADAPAGASIDSTTGRFQWTPEERQGPGVYTFTLRVTDDGLPARTSVQQVTVTVSESNQAPVIDTTAVLVIDEGSALAAKVQVVDADLPPNQLKIQLLPGAPSGLELSETTGEISWIPSENQGPATYRVGIRVEDNGVPSLASTNILTITVNEVNNPPVVENIQPVLMDEGTTLTLNVKAADPDDPGASLIYTLDGNPPEGMVLNADTGLLRWTPSESQGPANVVVVVRVTEKNAPGLSTARNFGVRVNEVNQIPALAAIGDFVVDAGSRIRFMAAATDQDLPLQRLAFSLGSGAPAEALIDSDTGLFDWPVPEDAPASTNSVSIRVLDDAQGSSGASQTFQVVIRPKFKVVINEVQYRPSAAGTEFIELMNSSAVTSWDLSNHVLSGTNMSFTFPAGIRLQPGGVICVVANLERFRASFGSDVPVAGVWTGSLGASADDLTLLASAASGQVLDRVQYRSSAPWPAAAAGSGPSLQVVDASRTRGRVANWNVAQNYTGPRALVGITNSWKFYQSGPLEASWKDPGFNDLGWREGRALLFVEDAPLPAAKNTPLTIGQNTYYFRTRFVLPATPRGATLVLSNIVDDGAVFYLNGREVYRQGIDPGPVEFSTVGYDFRSPKNAVGDAAWAGPFTIPLDGLIAGTNVLAVEVHQVNATSSDVVFGCTLFLEGGSLAPSTPGQMNSVAASLPEFPSIWINEVLPINSNGISDAQGEREPWVELVNTGNEPVRLDGLFLGNDYSNPAGWPFPAGSSIPAGGLLVVFADGEAGEGSGSEWHTGFRLNPSAGSVILSRLQGGAPSVLDFLDYSGARPGVSIASVPDGQVFARIERTTPTPGAPNGQPANRPPELAPIALQQALVGQELSIIATAVDPDAGQSLRYTFAGAVPSGMTLDPDSGRILFKPGVQNIGTNSVTVVVTDNGTPELSSSRTLVIVVREKPAPVLSATILVDGGVLLQWTARVGATYVVEAREELSDGAWKSLGEFVAASEIGRLTLPPVAPGAHQFFRVVVR